jgi:hypothetical protein
MVARIAYENGKSGEKGLFSCIVIHNYHMANVNRDFDFIIWLIIYIISAPAAIILLAREVFNPKKPQY